MADEARLNVRDSRLPYHTPQYEKKAEVSLEKQSCRDSHKILRIRIVASGPHVQGFLWWRCKFSIWCMIFVGFGSLGDEKIKSWSDID